ncbi:methyltransferase domain-containing protein [Helicobacter monodelphidis]|uniref:methyltransferase domain-containing protein n=1 Tax=Helicobacter sp. 15-1451 TaxID=2004995 RepID=UPI0015EBF489|nr:methyltransferase domain-containing protein [Helicobacter sp. 15-1451]
MERSEWSASLYLKFEEERSKPAIDLANRLRKLSPLNIVDVGCGPGNSTAILHSFFPNAQLLGVDHSMSMIESARNQHPHLSFNFCDAREISGEYDLIFANASLQWLPCHHTLIPFLMEKLSSNGVLAVQMPNNTNEPLYCVIDKMIKNSKWGFKHTEIEINETLQPQEYIEILMKCASQFEVWESIYYQCMPSHQSLIEWVRATKLRPYLNALKDDYKLQFENELLEQIIPLYSPIKSPTQDYKILFGFKRLFFIATK